MGKTLQNGDLVMRDEKVAFYEIPGQYAFIRMEGFTSMSTSKSATEHSRKYVDERSARSDVVGYEESISIALTATTGMPYRMILSRSRMRKRWASRRHAVSSRLT